MNSNYARVIMGVELLANAEAIDINSDFMKKIDPHGVNVVAMELIHDDGEARRLMCLFKLLGEEKPFEGTMTITHHLYKKIVHTIDLNTLEFIH